MSSERVMKDASSPPVALPAYVTDATLADQGRRRAGQDSPSPVPAVPPVPPVPPIPPVPTAVSPVPVPPAVSPVPALVAGMLGFALVTIDTSVVNLALPAIGETLGGGMTGLQWVVDAYTLAFAGLMLSTGAFSDRAGASRAYVLGLALFTVASAACGLAPSSAVLIGARVVQGVAAAVALPASLALVRQVYADPARRARAVALWTAGGSLAVAAGPVAGGVLTSVLGWRWVFFVNLPLGALALALLLRVPRSARRPAPLDLPGQLTAVLALGALAFSVIEGGTTRWAALAVAVAAGAGFLWTESHRAAPAVPLELFRNRTVPVVVAAGAAVSVAFYSMVFVFSLFFQRVQGHSALSAGLMFLPMTGLIAVVNLLAGRLSARFGPRTPMLAGQLIAMSGVVVILLFVHADTSAPVTAFLLVPLALGCALVVPPLTAAMMEAVPAERAGLAAGVLNSARQTAAGMGIAVFGTLVSGDFERGMHTGLLVSLVLLAAAAAGTLRLPRA